MRKWIIGALVVAALAGCSGASTDSAAGHVGRAGLLHSQAAPARALIRRLCQSIAFPTSDGPR